MRRFATVGLFALGFGLAAPAQAQVPTANGGTIGVAANYHPGGSNADQQARIADTHDLVVLGTGWADNGPPAQYYQTNPNIIAIVYQSWFDSGPGNPDYDFISRNHEDWFYHDAQGNRVATYSTAEDPECDPASCRANGTLCTCRFGMNLGHPGYRDYAAARFQDITVGGGAYGGTRGFDGVFMDNTFPQWPYRPDKVNSGWVSAVPVYSGGSTQTAAMWTEDQKGFIAAMRSGVGPNKTLVFNGCFKSSSDPSWQNNSYAYLEHADGCTMEDFVVVGIGTGATVKRGADWQKDVDLFQGVTDRGKWATPLIGSGVHSKSTNRYGIATMLLIWTGRKSCLNFWKGTAEEAIAGRFDQTFPEASVDLGSALERYVKLSNGVASRKFSKGRVLVNPTSATQTVDLGETMRTIEGASVTSVSLASGTAEILTKSDSSGNTPPGDVTGLERSDVK
jgi:hypothetical protein